MSKKKSGAGKLILGAAIGAALGALFAPKSGKENRAALKSKADELLDKAKEIDVNEVRETIEDKVATIMEEMKNLDKEKVAQIAKSKAKDLKKDAEDLVAYTKEKATPVIDEAAVALKDKTIEVTKKVLEKLESEK